MLARIRTGLSYANVVGTLALFIALGGVSYAAVKLPARSVGSKELKTGAVTSDKVRNGTLRKKDFKKGQLPRGADGSAGADGADGLPGMNGAAGPKGEPGVAGAKGDPGPVSSAGPAGPKGPGRAGAPGADGADGEDGADGAPGAPGTNGTNGSQGQQGIQGPPGTRRRDRTPGAPGIVATYKISSAISVVSAAENVWQFLGSHVTVTTTASQRLTASAMVPLATTATPQTIRLDFCYQNSRPADRSCRLRAPRSPSSR